MPNLTAVNNLSLADYLKSNDHSDIPLAKKLVVAFKLGQGVIPKVIAHETGLSLSYVSNVKTLIKGVS